MTVMFYILSFLTVYGALNAVLRKNLVTCALHLAVSMVALSGLFFQMGAYFIAGVQLVIYAGAVMVLFVMVIMLFDVQQKEDCFYEKKTLSIGKGALCIIVLGLLSGVVSSGIGFLNKVVIPETVPTKSLAFTLFSKYVFVFEWLGLLLLIIAVGVVILSKGEENDFHN